MANSRQINEWLLTEEGRNWLNEKKTYWYVYGNRPKKTFEAWIRYVLMGIFCTTAGVVKSVKIY